MSRLPGSLVLILLLAAPALAAPPAPLGSSAYDFPGAFASPGSATSASLGMADAWLGDEPFENPAIPPRRMLQLTPMLFHMSRQDLRGLNRSFSEQSAFFDAAGGWGALRLGSLAFFAYGHQPVLRREENAYLTGPQGGSPSPVENSATAREMRGGLGASAAWKRMRFGLAGEWTYRTDDYLTNDKSGSPQSGSTDVRFSGGGLGGQAGARIELGPAEGAGALTFGTSLRWVPEIELSGDQASKLVTSSSNGTVKVTRGSGVESGLSARWAATAQTRLLGAAGVRTTQEWKEFGVTRGGGGRWALAVEFHDARDPWTLRFGVGQETQRGTPEPRAGVVGLGIGWKIDTTVLDIGVVRHTFSHLGGATSYDDRVMATVALPF